MIIAPLLVVALAAVENGSVTGIVRAAGKPQARPPTAIAKDAAVCGRQAAAEAPRIGADGALANVVVVLRGARPSAPPAPSPNASIDQVGCRYKPHVQAVTVGTTLAVLNNDAVFHNVHAVSATGPAITLFNVAMPFKGQRLPTLLKRPGVMKLRCDAGHTWMTAWVHVVEHPWFAVTNDKGAFTIAGVPAGKYSLEYWHEPLDDRSPPALKSTPVEVTSGSTTTADVRLTL